MHIYNYAARLYCAKHEPGPTGAVLASLFVTGAAAIPRWFSKHLKYCSRGSTVVFKDSVSFIYLEPHRRSAIDRNVQFVSFKMNSIVKDIHTCSCSGAWPYSLLKIRGVAELVPHANFSTNHKLLLRRIIYPFPWFTGVKILPRSVHPIKVPCTLIAKDASKTISNNFRANSRAVPAFKKLKF